ncbi:polyprenol monophosphomannose synthase [Zhouia amylolytica]|uniref:Dolichyl-phosphate beta-d-mannosyltransferase n=1 Tax=Zhouia amylolytica AD3 TaxID=1286632 RepID=W2UIN1_9FLAO|nr:polyprenol monophosphomannose synthase [Zhouia amylolytica]ETN93779.1 dolichyl-phosphate beta-d-mannosyltransferase [Zhouia amylolytica AD3]
MTSECLVIIPTYNEIENIEAIIKAVFDLKQNYHVLIVDDNSPDGTADKVRELQKQFKDELFLEVRQEKTGLGTAYIHGFKWALKNNYDYIFEMDADFSHNPKDLPRLLDACINKGADLAIGSRYIKGVNVVNWPMGRIILSYGASFYVKLITGMRVNDPTAGFVCYKRSVIERLDLDKIQFVGYAFQIEMKFKAHLQKFKLVEVPIVFTDRVKGTSKMDGKIIYEAIWGVLKMKFNSLFRKEKFN